MRRFSQLDRSRRPPKHHHGRKHSHAQRTLKLLEASIAKCIKSVTDLKASTDRESLALLSQANIFSYDMQGVFNSLQRIVLRGFKDGASDPDLAAAVKKFSQFAYSVQQYFGDDPEVLKNQLKENLGKIMPEARGLVASVERNVNHEYIHEVVDAVDNILLAVLKIEYRNEHENDNYDDLITDMINLKDIIADTCNSFDHKNHSVLRDLKHACRESCQKMFRTVRFLDEAADYFSEEIKNVLLESSYGIFRGIAETDENVRLKSDVSAIKAYIIIGSSTVGVELENIIELSKMKIEDEEVANNLHNLVITLVVQVIAVGTQLNMLTELASNQISDD